MIFPLPPKIRILGKVWSSGGHLTSHVLERVEVYTVDNHCKGKTLVLYRPMRGDDGDRGNDTSVPRITSLQTGVTEYKIPGTHMERVLKLHQEDIYPKPKR